MNPKQYLAREMLGVILFPVFFFIVSVLFGIIGIIDREEAHIYWTIAGVNIIAGLLTLLYTYNLVIGRRRW